MATSRRQVLFFIKKTRWLEAMAADCAVNPAWYKVAGLISKHLNSESGDTFVGRGTIADILGMNVKSVDRAIAGLEAAGYLTVSRARGRGNSNTYMMAFPEKVETAAHTPPFETEKATPVSPFSDTEKATSDDLKGDISDDKRRHQSPPNLKNLTSSRTLEENGDEKFDVATPPPTPRSMQPDGSRAFKAEGLKPFTPAAPRSFKDRGSFEQRIAQMLTEAGVDGWDALLSMDEHKVAALCRRLRNKVLTPQEIADECAAYRQRRARAVG